MIQTHYPAHPLLNSLLSHDYASFAEFALKEREQAQWPPYSHVAVWRAEAPQRDRVFEFLNRLLKQAENCAENVELFGPAAAPMERMSGRFRAQLLFQSRARPALHDLLDRTLPLLRAWPEARRVRWSLDVDPIAL